MTVLNTEKSTVESEKNIQSDKERIDTLLIEYEKSTMAKAQADAVASVEVTDGATPVVKYRSSFATQFVFLFGRAGRNAWRNKFIVQATFFQALFVGLLMGLIYRDIPSQSYGQQIQNISGACFFIAVNQVFSAIQVLNVFAGEKVNLYKNDNL